MAENELIDEYARDTITADERKKLEHRLLRSKEQQQKLAFAMALDAEVEERAKKTERDQDREKDKVVPLPLPKPKPPVWFNPQLKIAAGIIIAVGLGVALWLLLQKSDVEKGMIALNQAQGNERLIQSRISQVNYAELRNVRGNETSRLKNTQARDYSERLFRDSIDQKQDAASYHALGRLYLAERSFEKAREQFQKALAKGENDPQLQSDMAAALMELGEQSGDDAQRAQYLGEAAQYLDRALQLNPSLPEALFNRALVYQRRRLPQAKEAWRRYLEVDSTSPWAKEADRNLKQLEAQDQKAQLRRIRLVNAPI